MTSIRPSWSNKSTFELDALIEEHQYLAEDYTKRSVFYKAKATARRDALADLVQREQEGRAKKGNTASRDILRSKSALDKVIDQRVSEDAVWKGHVANNQYYDRQAKLEADYVQILQAARTRVAGTRD